jgi:hypothetical protein
MSRVPERQINQAAYRQLRDSINQTYPLGRFVAVSHGQIVANAEDFDALRGTIRHMGKDPSQVLVVQAGVEYPEDAIIFVQDGQR